MKISCLNKCFLIGIGIIVISAMIHVFLTVKNYNSILTAVPLWMKVAFVIAFWGLLALLGTVVYCMIRKRLKK